MQRDPAAYHPEAESATSYVFELAKGRTAAKPQQDWLVMSALQRQGRNTDKIICALSRPSSAIAAGIPRLAKIVSFANVWVFGNHQLSSAIPEYVPAVRPHSKYSDPDVSRE